MACSGHSPWSGRAGTLWHSPAMEFLDAGDGVRIAYEAAGAGDLPLVLVHGWCCDRTTFAAQVAGLSRTHPVAALDLRGHGASGHGPADPHSVEASADDVLAVAAAAGFTRPVVVGHSLGGLVALACAARPGATRAAVLVDPAPVLDERGKAFFARSAEAVLADADGAWRRRFAAKLFGPGDDALRAEVVATMAGTPPAVAAAAARGLAGFDGAGTLARIEVPVLAVTAGEPEPGLREACPSLVLGRTVGAGHFLHVQVPDQLNPMIERFLRRL